MVNENCGIFTEIRLKPQFGHSDKANHHAKEVRKGEGREGRGKRRQEGEKKMTGILLILALLEKNDPKTRFGVKKVVFGVSFWPNLAFPVLKTRICERRKDVYIVSE